MPDQVNTMITDAVAQANVTVLGEAPALSLSNLYQSTSQALALAAGNAVTMQQQANVIHQTSTTLGIASLFGVETAAAGRAMKNARGGK